MPVCPPHTHTQPGNLVYIPQNPRLQHSCHHTLHRRILNISGPQHKTGSGMNARGCCKNRLRLWNRATLPNPFLPLLLEASKDPVHTVPGLQLPEPLLLLLTIYCFSTSHMLCDVQNAQMSLSRKLLYTKRTCQASVVWIGKKKHPIRVERQHSEARVAQERPSLKQNSRQKWTPSLGSMKISTAICRIHITPSQVGF